MTGGWQDEPLRTQLTPLHGTQVSAEICSLAADSDEIRRSLLLFEIDVLTKRYCADPSRFEPQDCGSLHGEVVDHWLQIDLRPVE